MVIYYLIIRENQSYHCQDVSVDKDRQLSECLAGVEGHLEKIKTLTNEVNSLRDRISTLVSVSGTTANLNKCIMRLEAAGLPTTLG